MTPEELTTAYCRLPPDRQALALADYAHSLTVVARGAYGPGSEDVANPQVLRRMNEVQHRVVGQIRHLLAGDEPRMPDDVFIPYILSAGDVDLTGLLGEAVRRRCG